jgi:hypothetical protein
MGRVWCGMVMYVFFAHVITASATMKMGTHDVGKLRFSRVYGLYRMGTHDLDMAVTQQVNITIKC